MSLLVVVTFSVLVCLVWTVAVRGWFESKHIWNDGICAESGFRWEVLELSGGLFLDDCHGRRVKLPAMVVHPVVTDALKRQRTRARV